MPVGFARSLLGGSATSGVANWSAYTGANDVEYTISDCSGIIGFKEFDSTRGLLVTYQAVGGSPGYDLVHVRLVTLDPSSNTLTFGSKINHGIANQATFTSKLGFLQKTATGEIVLLTADNNGTSRSYYLVSGVLTQSNTFNNQATASNPGAYRNTDGDYIQIDTGRTMYKIGLASTATANPTSTAIISKTWSGVTSDNAVFGDQIYGFADKNTVLAFQDVGTDLYEVKKYDITSGSSTPATISGLGSISASLETPDTDNLLAMNSMGMNTPHETTDFNDTAILIEKGYPSTAPADNTLRFHTYKNGDSVYYTNTLTQDFIGASDQAHCAFLGTTNSNAFIICRALSQTTPSRLSTYFIVDLNLSSNTSRVAKSEQMTSEIDWPINIFRFGSNYGLHNYESNKLKLMVP